MVMCSDTQSHASPSGHHRVCGGTGRRHKLTKNIYWMMVFMTDECVIIYGCWLQTHMNTISRTYHVWKPTNLIKFLFVHSLMIIGVREPCENYAVGKETL